MRLGPDLVILDLELPEMDGWQVLQRVREISAVPVLLLTAQGNEVDKVRGLTGGADDYVTKPFGPRELIARVEALLRRAQGSTEVLAFADGEVTLDEGEHRVLVSGQPLELTPTEFRLLAILMRNPRQVVTQEQLLDEVWGRRADPKQLRLYVSYLRRKFRDGRGRPDRDRSRDRLPAPLRRLAAVHAAFHTKSGRRANGGRRREVYRDRAVRVPHRSETQIGKETPPMSSSTSAASSSAP